MGGTAMMVSVILLSPKGIPAEAGTEARRTPSRVRPLMVIVGSDELVACVGFALTAFRPMDAHEGGYKRTVRRK
jgi:hypothetical protein